MSALTAPVPVNIARRDSRPGLGRLVAVELRKIVDTRAGFWMQVATVALTVVAVIVAAVAGDTADRTFAALLDVAILPAGVLLPVAGILLVTSEWSQRTGMVTFALVPVRSRVVVAKIAASVTLAIGMVVMVAGVVSAAALATGGAFTDAAPLIAQSAAYLTINVLTGVAFGMVVLASAPAIVALFALPIAWTAVATLAPFADAAPWLDTRLAYAPLTEEVLTGTQWARAGTALALWMLVPLAIGAWRIARREIAA